MQTTLNSVVETYLRAKRLARATRNEYFSTVRKWEEWGGGVPIQELGRRNIREFLDWVYERAVTDEGINPGRTANPHRRALQGESITFMVDWMGRTFRTRVNPLRDSGGRIVGTVGIALDVTDANLVEDEFRAARRIQEQMLPKQVPSVPGFDLAGVCHPASATGGDYYDYIPMPCGSLGIIVADVSRHGFASALIMAASKRVIRTLVEKDIPLGEALSIANRAIAEDTNSEYFVTLYYARINPKTRRLTYAGAGHDAYILDPTEPPRKLESTAFPLGVDDKAIGTCEDPITLAPGQLLLMFTDGYSEARAPAGGMFGTRRILEIAQAHRSKSAAEIIKALNDAVREFCHPGVPHDDLTVVVLKVAADQ